jgi:RNA polymerase sigma factor (sigma-70 family)
MQPPLQLALSPLSQLDDWPSDEALLSGMAGGVWGAGRALVRRYQRRVYGLALSIVGDRHRAEEIAHETFIRAWRDAGTHKPERASVSLWLLTITRDLAHGSLRRKVRPADVETTLKSADERARGWSNAESADEETVRAMTALSHLPVEQRRALVLAAIYGYSAREISEAESIPLDTAKARLRSGIEMMRSQHDPVTTVTQNKPAPSPPSLQLCSASNRMCS